MPKPGSNQAKVWQPLVYSPEEIEAERKALIKASSSGGDFAPGSFGCHEALHLACTFSSIVSTELCEHKTVISRPEYFKLAHEAHLALWNLYQLIGIEHLDEPNPALRSSRSRSRRHWRRRTRG
jgi:hypothetical protein